MEREDAIDYLELKDKLEDPWTREERIFFKNEEALIQRVIKEGRIFGPY